MSIVIAKGIISLLWYSGMRLSEVVNIKAKNFNWSEGTAIVLGKGNKFREVIIWQWFVANDSFETSYKGIQTMLPKQ